MGASMEFESHKDAVLMALEENVELALERIGMQAVSFAKHNIEVKHAVDTGNLMNSIAYLIQDHDCYIGTAVKYGKYVEYGTGVGAETGGRQTPWIYPMETPNGIVFAQTNGMIARPFLRPAVADHVEEYKAIVEDQLGGG